MALNGGITFYNLLNSICFLSCFVPKFMWEFISSSVGNFSNVYFGIYLDNLYELTPIGKLVPLSDYSTLILSFSLHSNNPIDHLALSFFRVSSTAVT